VSQFELAPAAQQWINVVLIWLGFGIAAGLLARALIPSRHPVSAVTTLVIGVAGTVLGPLAVSMLMKTPDFNPLGPLGLLSGVGGAAVLLLGHRVVAASFPQSEETAEEVEEEEDEDEDE
jgi:uncharacterized membrane protein YeaQ/YmgE (transglycosylase-associated protein family)